MKVVNENLEIVDYEEKKKEYETTGDIAGYKLMAKLTVVDLIYDMNQNTCHKMNFIIIGAQLLTLFASAILQSIFHEYRTIISLASSSMSIIMMCLVVINTKISDRAIKKANKQKEIIENYIDKISKRS